MLTFALVALVAFGNFDHTCRLDFHDLQCNTICQKQIFIGGAEISNFQFHSEETPTYPGPPPIEDGGTCVTSGHYEDIIETSRSCPVTCGRVVARPAQIFFKARVPCHKFLLSDGDIWAGNGTFTIFNTYSFVLGSGNPRPLHTSFTFDGTTWSESIVDVQGDLYASSRGKADNFFHTVMFDLARDGTRIYYNGYLIKAMRLGDADYTHVNEGVIQLAGASEPWYNTILIKDNSCTSTCSDIYDCSGRGTTPSVSNENGCTCDCDCDDQFGCWGGPDCSEQTVIPLGGSKSCAGRHLDDFTDRAWDDCLTLCRTHPECGYFAHNQTNGCRLFLDCAPIVADYSLYQNSERICPAPGAYSMGSAFVKLQEFSKFQEDVLEIYFQTPSTYDLSSLEFRTASHACAQWNIPDTETDCPNSSGYWTPSGLGCLTLYTGTFLFREIYNPAAEINFAGFKDKNGALRSVLMAEVEEITSHDGLAVKRSYHYIMPYNLEVAGTMQLEVTGGVQDQCQALGTNCPACQICEPESGNCIADESQFGTPCDDMNIHTFPDHCYDGVCTGPLICASDPPTCPLCQLCVEHFLGESGSPCPGEACHECITDESLEFKSCDDGTQPLFENICIQGECVGETTPCDCKCDQNGCGSNAELGCGCDHRTCPVGSLSCCDAGYCRQDGLTQARCRFGHCSQLNAIRPRCNGGFCDQTGATRPTCDGGNCVQDSTSEPTCDGGFCSQLGASDALCSEGCEENACSDVTCGPCESCTLPDGVCVLDNSAGGCPDCEICIDGGCIRQGIETEGNKCEDGVAATYHDRCDMSGNCVGIRCTEICEEGNCNQDARERPCCFGGGCSQLNAISAMCQGGGCDQTDSNAPTCDGGGCTQLGASNPDCSVIPNCSGNCAIMSCSDCQKCVNGFCVEDPDARTCDKGFEFFDEVCVRGVCSGTHYLCLAGDYNECMECDANFGDWSPRESADPIPCGDPDRELYCTGGRCLPAIAAAELIDDFIMNVGIQESDVLTMKSIISLDGASRLNWPWKMIEDESFFVQGLFEEEITGLEFEILSDCPVIEDANCEQEWRLALSVDKVCDDVSYYTVNFPLRSMREGEEDKESLLPYAIAVAQVAACGVILSEDTIQAELRITDETYENPNSFPYINVGKNIYFHLSVGAIAPIDRLEPVSMTLNIGQDGVWENSMNIIGPDVSTALKTQLEVNPVSEENKMYWYVYLHPSLFNEWSEEVGTSVRMSLTVEVFYARRKRRLLAVSTEGYDFAEDFFLLEYRCVDDYSGQEALMDSYIEVECPPELGRGKLLMYCSAGGWSEDDEVNLCQLGAGGDVVLQSNSEGSSIAWYFWVSGSLLLFVSAVLIWSYIPKKKMNYYCSKLFGVENPEHKKPKKGHSSSDKKNSHYGQSKSSASKGTSSRIGEPGPPNDHTNPRGSTEGGSSGSKKHSKHGHDHGRGSSNMESRKKHSLSRKSISGHVKHRKSSGKSPRSVNMNVRKSLMIGPAGGNSAALEGARKSIAVLKAKMNNGAEGAAPARTGARKSVMLGKAKSGPRKSLAAITPLAMTGQRKSFAAGVGKKSLMKGRKSTAYGRKSLVGKSFVPKPALQHQISKKQAKKSKVSTGAYAVCSSLADAQKMKQLFAKKKKNVKLYE